MKKNKLFVEAIRILVILVLTFTVTVFTTGIMLTNWQAKQPKPLSYEELRAIWEQEANYKANIEDPIGALGLGDILNEPGDDLDGNIDESVDFNTDSLPVAVDLSATKYFPIIQSQGSIGSCSSWSSTYYQFTYEVARLKDWEVRNTATTNNTSRVFSPKFTYNLINGGSDAGSNTSANYSVLQTQGCATWAEFPYTGSAGTNGINYREWPTDASIYRNALNVRLTSSSYILANSNSVMPARITQMKTWLSEGKVLKVSTEWNWQRMTNVPGYGQVVTHNLTTTSGHGLTIVGYDDNLTVTTAANETLTGAFKIANSHGTSYGNSGYIWVMYDALYLTSTVAPSLNATGRVGIFNRDGIYIMNVQDFTPINMTAEVTLNSATRSSVGVSLGKSSNSYATISTLLSTSRGGAYGFGGSTAAFAAPPAATDASFAFSFNATSAEATQSLIWRVNVQCRSSTASVTVKEVKFFSGQTLVSTVTPNELINTAKTVAYDSNMSYTGSISLSEIGTYTFASAQRGYSNVAARTVTINNTGTAATGALSVALSGTDSASFTLSVTTVNSIAVGGTANFTVVPKTGLGVKTHTAAVTVSGLGLASKNFNVTFVVTAAPAVPINLSTTGTHTFAEKNYGYSAITPHLVTVTNTGTANTDPMTVALSGTDSSSFTLSVLSLVSLAPQATTSFTVVPKTGLAVKASAYQATVTVSGDGVVSQSFIVSFKVSTTVVQTVAITVQTPEVGATRITTAPAGGIGYTCGSVSWSPSQANTFQEARFPYTATVRITASTGYTLTGLTSATINGFVATVTNNTGTLADVSYSFALAPTIISSAAITSVTAPVAGNTPSTVSSSSGNFTRGNVTWLPAHSPFQAGTVYTASIVLTANSGYNFSDPITATLNGNTAAVSGNNGTTVTLSYAFPATATAIATAAITITAPITGNAPSTTSTGSGNFTRGNVTWSPTSSPFRGNTVYTASITLTANTGNTFVGIAAANTTINGNRANVSNNTGSAITLSYQFSATVAAIVTGVSVQTQPTALTYNFGDSLNLTGIVVRLTYNDTATENVTFANFASSGITTNPEHGTKLNMSHDGTSVTVTCNSISANTSNLTVNAVRISTVAVIVTAPSVGATPNTTATASGNFAVTSVSWSPVAAVFLGATQYTVTVLLTANNGYTFTNLSINNTTINGEKATTMSGSPSSTVTLTYQFAATASSEVASISVTSQPAKLIYLQGESLDLTGLQVKINYGDGTDASISYSSSAFNSNGITASPAHGTSLTLSHNGIAIIVSCGGKTANTGTLAVSGVIANVSVSITAPVVWAVPDTAATVETGANYTSGLVSWQPNHNPFQGNSSYVASVTLTAKTGYTFAAGLLPAAALINGNPATSVANNTGTAITLSYTFTTSDVTVTSIIIVTQPTKLVYVHNDLLDLSGLVVLVLYSDGSDKDFPMADFDTNSITTSLAHGSQLQRSQNGTAITVSLDNKSADINALTIDKANPREPVLPNVLLKEGLTLADIDLPEGWVWAEPNTVLAEGTSSYKAIFGGDENYNGKESMIDLIINNEPTGNKFKAYATLFVLGLMILGISALMVKDMIPRKEYAKVKRPASPPTPRPTPPTSKPVPPPAPRPVPPPASRPVPPSAPRPVSSATPGTVPPSAPRPVSPSAPRPVPPPTSRPVPPSTPRPVSSATPGAVPSVAPRPVPPPTSRPVPPPAPRPVPPTTPPSYR